MTRRTASAPPPCTRPRVPGILLEGGCFSGKSSVAAALAALLAARGLQPAGGHCYVCEDARNARLHALALASFGERLPAVFRDPDYFAAFNRFRSRNIAHDARRLRERCWMPGQVQVQDRHWFSQHCQNTYFTPDANWLPTRWRRHEAPRFDLHVFLRCRDAARRAAGGAGVRAGEHGVHRHFRRFPDALDGFESHCVGLWPAGPDWLLLEMDDLTAGAAAHAICDAFFAARQAAISRKPAP